MDRRPKSPELEELLAVIPQRYSPLKALRDYLRGWIGTAPRPLPQTPLYLPAIIRYADSWFNNTPDIDEHYVAANAKRLRIVIKRLGPLCDEDIAEIHRWALEMVSAAQATKSVMESRKVLLPSDLCKSQTPAKGCCKAHDTERSIKGQMANLLRTADDRDFEFDLNTRGPLFPSGASYPHYPYISLSGLTAVANPYNSAIFDDTLRKVAQGSEVLRNTARFEMLKNERK